MQCYRVTDCHTDGVAGGGFAIEADGRPSVGITVEPDTALRFLSLKNGDIVRVTLRTYPARHDRQGRAATDRQGMPGIGTGPPNASR